MQLKRSLIMLISLVAIIGLMMLLWGRQHVPMPAQKGGALVRVVTVTQTPMPTTVNALGSLSAIKHADMAAEDNNTIENILFTEGSRVEAGTLLIQLNDNLALAKLKQAKAQASLKELDYNRAKSLLDRGAMPKQEVDKTEADLKVAKADVAIAEAELAKTQIKAPFDGELGPKIFSEGQYVPAGTTLVSIVDNSRLKIQFAVPQRYVSELRVGMPVNFQTPAFPLETFQGVVDFINPSIDVSTRTIGVEAVFDNSHQRLSPGLFGSVNLVLRVNDDAMIVPEESLLPTIKGYQVYRVVNNQAEAIDIQIGTRKDGQVHVLTGLSPEDVIVTQGQQNLREGMPVQILEEKD